MAKLNTLALERRKPQAITRSFEDPDHPGLPFTLTMIPPGILEAARAETCGEELIEKWIDGPNGPARFAMPGECPYLERKMLEAVARIWACQSGPEEDQYTPDELIAAALAMPSAWMEVMLWVGELFTNRRSKVGKTTAQATTAGSPPAAPSATGSPAPPFITTFSPQSPSTGSPPSSIPSMNGWDPSTREPGSSVDDSPEPGPDRLLVPERMGRAATYPP